MTKKCNPGIGAVPVNVIMIVLQIGPTYQTCINFAEKLMVLRCYDHNLITDCKRRLWIWSGLFSVAFYENAAVSILRTAITLTSPTLHLCHKQSRLYFPLAFRTRPRWSLGFVQGIAAGACVLQLRRFALAFIRSHCGATGVFWLICRGVYFRFGAKKKWQKRVASSNFAGWKCRN